ncbi:MAG: TadE/TadG family type IV pilus assembly protein [Myxococcota bacterium]
MERRLTFERGANALEFALLLPVFLLLLGGSIDLSWLMLQRGAMRTAVGRGCRQGSLVDPGLKEATVNAVHTAAKAAVLDAYEGSVGTCASCVVDTQLEGTIPNRVLRCKLQAPWSGGLTPILSGLTAGTMNDEAVARLEFQRAP